MNEQALKDRLKHIASTEEKSHQEVWKSLLLERLLVRLASSKYYDKFIFKGGLLLSYYMVIARETVDIDFLARTLQAEIPQLKNILSEICNTKVDDGFAMTLQSIAELEHNHMSYPGYRAKLDVKFENMKDRIQIDIGVGDVVDPTEISWPLYRYKDQPVFEEVISLQAYPVESIFSEKLETIVSRGAVNSRMKDFHDVLLLCRKDGLVDAEKLKKSIEETFRNRNTEITIPLLFSVDDRLRLQAYWSEYLRTIGHEKRVVLNLPSEISKVIDEVNTWLVNCNVEV